MVVGLALRLGGGAATGKAMTPACWSATLALSFTSLMIWNQSTFWLDVQKSARRRTPPGSRDSTSVRGGGSVRIPQVSRWARFRASIASAVEASLGTTTSKLLRKLGEAVALTMISLKMVELGMRTCLPSRVTRTVARVFSDLTTPDCPAIVT